MGYFLSPYYAAGTGFVTAMVSSEQNHSVYNSEANIPNLDKMFVRLLNVRLTLFLLSLIEFFLSQHF